MIDRFGLKTDLMAYPVILKEYLNVMKMTDMDIEIRLSSPSVMGMNLKKSLLDFKKESIRKEFQS